MTVKRLVERSGISEIKYYGLFYEACLKLGQEKGPTAVINQAIAEYGEYGGCQTLETAASVVARIGIGVFAGGYEVLESIAAIRGMEAQYFVSVLPHLKDVNLADIERVVVTFLSHDDMDVGHAAVDALAEVRRMRGTKQS